MNAGLPAQQAGGCAPCKGRGGVSGDAASQQLARVLAADTARQCLPVLEARCVKATGATPVRNRPVLRVVPVRQQRPRRGEYG